MARFSVGLQAGHLRRLLVVGVLVAVGWVLGVIFGLFGLFGAAPAAADAAPSSVVTVPALADDLPMSGDASADTEAMAGRKIDGLTSQSTPALPAPSTADPGSGANGLIPQVGGGSIVFGDVARSFFHARFTRLPAPVAAVLPPVVRTAADDPSISPD